MINVIKRSIPYIALTIIWVVLPVLFLPLETSGTVLLTGCAFFAWVFVFLYGFKSKWWIEPVGQAMMTGNIFFAMVLTQNSFSSWTNQDYPFRSLIRLLLYGSLLSSGIWLIVTLRNIQNEEAEIENKEELEIEEGEENNGTT